MNPLFENWRKRVRGYNRRPILPVHGGWPLHVASEDQDSAWAPSSSLEVPAAENGHPPGGRPSPARPDEAAVLPFPSQQPVQPTEPPPPRPRGPLSWAYWSARKN